MNQCPTCQGPLEGIEFAARTRFAVWCPSCRLVWQPQPIAANHPQAELEPMRDPFDVVRVRELKAQLERSIGRRSEKSGANS